MASNLHFLALLSVCLIATVAHRHRFKIYDGIDIRPNEFPFLAAIFSEVEGTVHLYCSASIVHSNYLLTAAHCLDDARIDHVRVGNSEVRFRYGKRHEVAAVYKHEGYIGEGNLFQNDIALVKLATPILSDEGIRLPVEHHEGNIYVVGYGFKPLELKNPMHKGPVHPDHFNSINPSKAQYAVLQKKFFNTHIGCANVNPANQICYSQINQGITQGDSGGPLVIDDGLNAYQVGISSANSYNVLGEHKVEILTIFTRVSAYCDWMAQKTDNEVTCD
uniref:Peptidase S1 domain-containing protein n=1 Tax=Panagrellus redivivus TaxID=6233 RepID=A0A7E4ZX01_PANRE